MSSADKGSSKARAPSWCPGYAAKNGDHEAGEGRAYTQNPATAQASDRGYASELSRSASQFRNPEAGGQESEARADLKLDGTTKASTSA